MPAKKNLTNLAGIITEVANTIVSTGASDDGKTVGLDAAGKLDPSVMPLGFGTDTNLIVTSEAIAAGDLVNVWNNAGTFNVRKANGAAGVNQPAHGFCNLAFASGATATVFSEGTDVGVTGLLGGEQFLSITVAGRSQAAPPATAGSTLQRVGVAVSATSLNFQQGLAIVLA